MVFPHRRADFSSPGFPRFRPLSCRGVEKRPPGAPPMARPLKPILPDQVVALARLGWSVAEMAEFFDCNRGTLYKRFGAELREGKAARGPSDDVSTRGAAESIRETRRP